MQSSQLPPCRLFIIFARQAKRAVIFRRGPSDWTELILWHTDTDEFVAGQWFKGRIYERRCDLSPDGTKLIYFAQKINKRTLQDREYTYAWTAVSKPPYLTALALWPKGDCWHGGGLFEDDRTVFLNHRPESAQPHPKHRPQGLTVRPNPEARGENDPLYSSRLDRDGWQVEQKWRIQYKGPPRFYVTEQAEIRARKHPHEKYWVRMSRQLDGLKYREVLSVRNQEGNELLETMGVSWADWDQNGRLVLLKDGKLLIGAEDVVGVSFRTKELADFNAHRPEERVAPPWATR